MEEKIHHKELKNDDTEETDTDAWQMVRTFAKLATPATVTQICDGLMVNILPIYFTGKLNNADRTAGTGLALTLNTLFITCLTVGSMKPMETFTTHAYGSNQMRLCGIYLNKARFAVTAFFVPIVFVLVMFSRNILLVFG